MGINTRGISRGRPVAIPLATVNRIVDELVEKGHISKPYLGLAMQPVAVPQDLARKIKAEQESALRKLLVSATDPS